MSNDQSILNDLKKGAILTGRLSEVHAKTLQSSPFVFFDDLKKVEVSYNLVTDHEASEPGLGTKVSFKLTFEGDWKSQEHLPKRVEALLNTVKTILWPSVEISIFDDKGRSLLDV